VKNAWIVCLALIPLACSRPAPQPPDVALAPAGENAAPKTPEKPAPSKARVLTNWDRGHRLRYKAMNEIDLRSELIRLAGEVLKKPNESDLYAFKAMVAEELTKFDAERGTNHWDRAYVHYTEAIEKCQALVDAPDPDGPKAAIRVAQLKYYRTRPARMLGKDKEASDDRNDALANATVQKQIQQAEDGPQDD
jgi:hypothetical protein